MSPSGRSSARRSWSPRATSSSCFSATRAREGVRECAHQRSCSRLLPPPFSSSPPSSLSLPPPPTPPSPPPLRPEDARTARLACRDRPPGLRTGLEPRLDRVALQAPEVAPLEREPHRRELARLDRERLLRHRLAAQEAGERERAPASGARQVAGRRPNAPQPVADALLRHALLALGAREIGPQLGGAGGRRTAAPAAGTAASARRRRAVRPRVDLQVGDGQEVEVAGSPPTSPSVACAISRTARTPSGMSRRHAVQPVVRVAVERALRDGGERRAVGRRLEGVGAEPGVDEDPAAAVGSMKTSAPLIGWGSVTVNVRGCPRTAACRDRRSRSGRGRDHRGLVAVDQAVPAAAPRVLVARSRS